jgi:hypothetical protein
VTLPVTYGRSAPEEGALDRITATIARSVALAAMPQALAVGDRSSHFAGPSRHSYVRIGNLLCGRNLMSSALETLRCDFGGEIIEPGGAEYESASGVSVK